MVIRMSNAKELATDQPSTIMQNPTIAKQVHPVQIYEMNIAPK